MATNALDALIEALRRLPGVGVKSASRMAFHLLQHDRAGAQVLAQALQQAASADHAIAACATPSPRTRSAPPAWTRGATAASCAWSRRPADQAAVERTAAFKGLYFVLMGKLSPLDGIGPKDIGLAKLFDRATDGVVQEVILATNFTAEGEATAHVIGEALKARGLNVTRLARGVPAGSELEYVDLGTIAHALVDRR